VDTPHSSVRAFAVVASGYWTAPGYRGVAWLLTAGLALTVAGNVGIALWLNLWNRDFFNALEQKDLGALFHLLWVLAAIVVSAGIGVAIQLHIKRRLQFNWRDWLSRVTVHRWLNAGRQYQLGLLADEIDNPDGRIAEDIRVSTEYAVEFAGSILQCFLQLVTFLGVLWVLSGALPVSIGPTFQFSLPGYMVWAAVLYALIGSLLTYALGRGLIEAGNQRQSREADFRSSLTRAREHAESIALLRGEGDERERLRGSLFDLRSAWHRQTRGQGNLSLLTSSLAYLAPVVPLVVALPRYLSGEIQLGGLMQTAQAFSSVQWALSWLIDNFPKFADWRASTDRVVHLHVALADLQHTVEKHDERITLHEPATADRGGSDRLVLRDLGLARPDGEMLVAEAEVEIRRPERVLIRGQSGSGKSTIMRAVAGVWPWGKGEIHLPQGKIAFLPQKPYFPLGTLREALLYPEEPPEGITDEILRDTLHKVGLDHLRDRLDEVERWDHILSGGEQQRVAFARTLVHKPEWIFMDEATSALDEAGQENVMKLLIEELPETSIVSIGHRPGLEVFHTRELVLEPGAEGARLSQAVHQRHSSLHDVYRRLSKASRNQRREPGFWATLRANLGGPPPRPQNRRARR
jgi:vitamin B12/bleomycin/antimicrobial peptide transport system ATP-binding/permease protein